MPESVCADCFGSDPALRKYIEKYAEYNSCDYCYKESDSPLAVDFDRLVSHIDECIRTEWIPAGDFLHWAHEAGGFIGNHCDTYDLLLELQILPENDQLSNDLIHALHDETWCLKEYNISWSDTHILGWEHFSEIVKHQVRYVFFRFYEKHADREDIPPNQLLDKLAASLNSVDVIRRLDAGATIYRGRVDDTQRFAEASDLVSPPVNIVKYPNRMSPAGISMFYGAFDAETALAEIRPSANSIASIGLFKTLKPMYILDLTSLGDIPSLFEEGDNHLEREIIIFLHSFVENIKKPIREEPDKKALNPAIEYVPTQIFAEYIRHILLTRNGNKVSGIIYPSAIASGKNCVLFLTHEECLQRSWIDLESVEHRIIKENKEGCNLLSRIIQFNRCH